MSKQELVDAYLDGKVSRQKFLKLLVGAGFSVAAAGTYAEVLDSDQARAAAWTHRRAPTTPNPTISGPIPAPVAPGDPSHNYPYFATQFDIHRQGYTEKEFFFTGMANRYGVVDKQMTTATVLDSGHPFKTRMVVRRPTNPRRFNGTVLVEWYNVTVGFDVEADWFRVHEEIVRAGYAWVGISAQAVGVNFLKSWSPDRYGSLDVTEGGTVTGDTLGWDIYSQALQAIKHPRGITPLGNLNAKRVIALGESSSASKLTQYYNAIQPLAGLADAFILNGAPEPDSMLRTDLSTPAFKLSTETDIAALGGAQTRQADSNVLRSWEVAGTAHVDLDMLGDDLSPTAPGINPVQWRDTRTFQDWTTCDLPTLPRTHYKYVYQAVIEHVDKWIRWGIKPPHAPQLDVVSVGPGPRDAVLARDSFGIAQGGIRLAAVAVPTATNASPNSPGFFCSLFGQYLPFDAATLARLYPTHGSYVAKVARVTDQNVKAGFILGPDAWTTVEEAAHSSIGHGT